MTQLNIHMTPEFEEDLLMLMRVRKLPSKAEAVRTAIKESLKRSLHQTKKMDFSTWLGAGNEAPINKKNKFKSDDDLWK